ncbi:MAG: hypothetical protein ABJG47_09370 [Ekhidna sp.]
MKKHVTLLSIILFISSLAMAQNFEAPKKGAKIHAQEYTLNLDVDGDTTFDLWIVRSKAARKAKFSAPSLLSGSELTFEVTQDPENLDHYLVKVSAKGVEAGQYFTTVSAKSKSTQKVTGTTLTFSVNPEKSVASKDGE